MLLNITGYNTNGLFVVHVFKCVFTLITDFFKIEIKVAVDENDGDYFSFSKLLNGVKIIALTFGLKFVYHQLKKGKNEYTYFKMYLYVAIPNLFIRYIITLPMVFAFTVAAC